MGPVPSRVHAVSAIDLTCILDADQASTILGLP